jgi:hypothetical protein
MVGYYRLEQSGFGKAQMAGSAEHDNELPGSIKCRVFLD